MRYLALCRKGISKGTECGGKFAWMMGVIIINRNGFAMITKSSIILASPSNTGEVL